MTRVAGIGGSARLSVGLRRAATIGLVAAGLASFLPAGAPAMPARIFPITAVPSPRISTEAQARHAMLRHGLKNVTQLGPVGDYWEANADKRGKPVVVYLFADGTLRVERHPKIMVEAGGRMARRHAS